MTRIYESTVRRFGLPRDAHIETSHETLSYSRLAKAGMKYAQEDRIKAAHEKMMKERNPK